ncbi:hypothetical protein TCAL_02553 [Tigriopus californicus]|uniref:Ig-like domain-containing protein n=1 Tax=Tigriopus californicus TaxID=6832 RepID=A0A553P7Y7_TIGCA|nr:uncharacterized protein LOC131877796 [Tigriopus californicus]TRY73760.1 hypothetical protein TCAL_02553 [Tigriopus californicus]
MTYSQKMQGRRPRTNLLLLFLVSTYILNLFHLCLGQEWPPQKGNGRDTNRIVPNRESRAIQVINKSPPDGRIVKLGHSVRLSCRTDRRWFFCLWNSPQGDKQCAIQLNSPRSVCDLDSRIIMDSGLNNCDIEVKNVQPEDYGSWLCMVSDPDQFDSARERVSLEVGQPASVKFDPEFGSKNVLTITEGETISIRCAATKGHPAAQLSWEGPKEAKLDIRSSPEIIRNDRTHTTDVFHTVKYKADLKDNDKEIICLATQVDHDGRSVLYESSAILQLKIDKIVLPVDNALTQRIGIISGVLLAIIFLILLLMFCIFVICRRRRKRSRPPSSQATLDSSPEPPLKPIWTTDPLMGQSSPRKTERQINQLAYADILEPAPRRANHRDGDKLNQTGSQGSSSTRSTTSQGSWEEDRSVGGELEDISIQRAPSVVPQTSMLSRQQSPSLHETHFGSDTDLPRTVLHHPDPFLQQQQLQQQPIYSNQQFQQQPVYGRPNPRSGRPASSADAVLNPSPYYPNHSLNRPHSALSYPNSQPDSTGSYIPTILRRLPTPNGQLTTSTKSVFDCDLGCFDLLEEEEHSMACPHHSSRSNSTDSEITNRTKDVEDRNH